MMKCVTRGEVMLGLITDRREGDDTDDTTQTREECAISANELGDYR